MRETEPKVFLIARPQIIWNNIQHYLEDVGGSSWITDPYTCSDAELLSEFAGRVCYRSWKPGLNVNVIRVRKDKSEYHKNVLRSRHGSVLEHANFTFAFRQVSRVFTHELVRHRAGVAISQESLRYVRLTDLGFRIPEVLEPLRNSIVEMVERMEEFQVSAAKQMGLDDDNLPFAEKKVITSALRRLAPLGLSTDIIWTANVRTIRHVLEQRTAQGAEEEIRTVFNSVGHIMMTEVPMLFQDFTCQENNEWTPMYSKV